MGFLYKYSALSLIVVYLAWSVFLSINGLLDVVGDVKGSNYTTRIHLEELEITDNDKLEYVQLSERELKDEELPWPGLQQF